MFIMNARLGLWPYLGLGPQPYRASFTSTPVQCEHAPTFGLPMRAFLRFCTMGACSGLGTYMGVSFALVYVSICNDLSKSSP